jgi:hypothetical protein
MWWLICLIICIGCGVICYCSGWGDLEDFLFGSIFVSIPVNFLVLLLSLMLSFSSAPSYESSPQPIAALADSNLIQDCSFFLGCGTIDEELTYTFVKGTPEEGLSVEQVPAKHCVIKYTDKAPYYTKGRNKLNAFGRFMWGVDSIGTEEYTFYVPKGTVTTEFNVDLQ